MLELSLLRQGSETSWFWFADNVVECVAGKRVWGKEKTMRLMTDAVTASDEAFALLLNNWDKWLAEQDDPPRKIDAMYTSSTKGDRKFRGWGQDGIIKYNELLAAVERSREMTRGKAAEKRFLEMKVGTIPRYRKRGRADTNGPQRIVKANHKLFAMSRRTEPPMERRVLDFANFSGKTAEASSEEEEEEEDDEDEDEQQTS